ncbi:MAG: T9SS type A sorting domain-containing protein [Bacteroidia bacterium]
MRALITLSLFLLILAGQLIAQSPAGDLYTFGSGSTYYITYPAATSHALDSLGATNMTNSGAKLYTSWAKENRHGIASYDLSTHQRLDSSSLHPAIDVDVWDNMLVVTSHEAPFLRVVNPVLQYQPRFELLDSAFMRPIETLVHDDRAYVLFGDRVAVVDLDLEDTLAVIRTDTVPQFWATLYNLNIAEVGGQVFIYGEYATGAIRSAILEIDVNTLTVHQAEHVEFDGFIGRPVAGDQKLYVYRYPAHFDLNADSLVRPATSPVPNDYAPIAYDAISKTVFLRGRPIAAGFVPFVTVQNGQAGATMNLKPHTKGHFVSLQTINGIDAEHRFQYAVGPNPTADVLDVSFPAPTKVFRYRVTDSRGRTLLAGNPTGNRGFQVDLRSLPRGGYFLEIQSNEGNVSEPVVKW